MSTEMLEETVVRTERPRTQKKRDTTRQTKKQPPYAVVLHNDDVNTFEYVILVLQKVFGYGEEKAYAITLAAHTGGQCIVWSGAREHAELKADQIVACGPDPDMEHKGAQPLRVTVEPLPSE